MSIPAYQPHERLLHAFDSTFRGKIYKHRNQSIGNWIAAHFYDDLLKIEKSQKFASRVRADASVLHKDVKVVVGAGRRGDGAFGDLIPGGIATVEEGFLVKRGPVGQIEIGAEFKILAKAMIKQIDRVIGDLNRQVTEFNITGGKPICVAFIGVNHADRYVSFEGERSFPTDGKAHRHPSQEAPKAIARLAAVQGYDEVLVLRFKAANTEPFDFEWVNLEPTRQQYAALLLRVSKVYEGRF